MAEAKNLLDIQAELEKYKQAEASQRAELEKYKQDEKVRRAELEKYKHDEEARRAKKNVYLKEYRSKNRSLINETKRKYTRGIQSIPEVTSQELYIVVAYFIQLYNTKKPRLNDEKMQLYNEVKSIRMGVYQLDKYVTELEKQWNEKYGQDPTNNE